MCCPDTSVCDSKGFLTFPCLWCPVSNVEIVLKVQGFCEASARWPLCMVSSGEVTLTAQVAPGLSISEASSAHREATEQPATEVSCQGPSLSALTQELVSFPCSPFSPLSPLRPAQRSTPMT